MSPRLRLTLAAVAFVGWIAYLGYAVAMKSRAPVVSHAQAAAATTAVVAELGGTAEPVAVVEKLWGEGPAAGPIEVLNLADSRGFTTQGKYLLYLVPRHGGWLVVGQQRSPGSDLSGVTPVLIYPWGEDVRKQAEKLRR